MIAAAGVLNAVAFGLSVCVAVAWLHRKQVSAPLVAWAGLALACSPLAGVAAHVWSEAVFVLFVLAALFSLDRFLVAGTRRMLFVSAGFAALCCLTRYAGASVLVCATVLIAMRSQWRPTRRVRAAALYAAVGIVPTVVWLLRNLRVLDSVSPDWSIYQEFSAMDTFHMAVELMLHTTVGPTALDWIDAGPVGPSSNGTGTRLLWLLAIWGLVACGFAVSRPRGACLSRERARTVSVYHAGEIPSLMEFLRSFPGMGVMATHADGIVFRQGATHRADDTAWRRPTSTCTWPERPGTRGVRLMYVKHGCEPADIRPKFFSM